MMQKLTRVLPIALATFLVAGCTCRQKNTEPEGTTSILFVGNSYTYHNDMPSVFADLMQAGGHKIFIDVVAAGGQTLADHAASTRTLQRIEAKNWDYVIVQEQSVLPSQKGEREQEMYPPARTLDRAIRENGGKMVLFMTWGRRDGLTGAGFADFTSMQAELSAGYLEIGYELDAIVAPVGVAWQNGLEQSSQLELWDPDGSHPSENGSYLAACVFYATICRESPEGLSYLAGLSKETAQWLQAVAAETVLTDSQRWNLADAE
jgi:hypothetical protein